MKNLANSLFAFILIVCSCNNSILAQLQDRLYAGPSNGGTNLEICYSVTNTVAQGLTLNTASENQITILYGKAPLDGYFTEPSTCLDIANYNISSTHASVDLASMSGYETENKLLWLSFSNSSDLIIPSGSEVELFCLNWTIQTGACADLVYWTFCDNEVADTYFNDTQIFPLGTDCTEGDPQQGSAMIALPVVFSDFSGTSNHNANQLSWTTASEVNNDYFSLERSQDGISYEEITKVRSQGNSNQKTRYSHNDVAIFTADKYYYRIIQYDLDGTKYVHSKVLILNGVAPKTKLHIFPVPVKDLITLQFDNENNTDYSILVYAMTGDLILEKQISSRQRQIDLSALTNGMYTIAIVKDHEILKQKFLKL